MKKDKGDASFSSNHLLSQNKFSVGKGQSKYVRIYLCPSDVDYEMLDISK